MEPVTPRPATQERFSDRALLSVRRACSDRGLPSGDAKLLRVGENALFHLPAAGAVARVGRSLDHWGVANKEVEVAHWLAAQGVPAAAVLDVRQPVSANGSPVTFWHFIDGRPGERRDLVALGSALRLVHALPRPNFLRADAVLDRVEPRIAKAPLVDRDRDFLLQRCSDLRERLINLNFPLERTAVHGDAHIKNLMIAGQSVLIIDFERFSWGQPEWDLAMTATEYVTAGWWTDTEYDEFVAAYGGFDITAWSGFEVLRSVNELKMTTWIMQNVDESDDVAAEFERRMRSLRGGECARDWTPF